tara:strand:+ start:726 stop:1043 length:318 start_codon:yes stop_codon:yes gene_type:complete
MKYGTPEYRAHMRNERRKSKERRQAKAAAERQARIERENSGKVVVVKQGSACKREVTVNGKSIGFATRDNYGRFGLTGWSLRPYGGESISCDSLDDLRRKAAELA